ncbi:MAG: hypothetical protein QNJ55_27545 [Xenococcus sp. MO_188.B8]|nr:hypothetical protein [Xenococcus sp. MO_188.B8]
MSTEQFLNNLWSELSDRESAKLAGGNPPGYALCQPVPGADVTSPAGGPGYGFEGPPPANENAFNNVCGEGPG